MEKYIINNLTLAIVPNGQKSIVIEKYATHTVNLTPTNLIDMSCRYYGSSLKGRCDGTYFMMGVKYKCPIVLSETKQIIFFPTSSYKDPKCIWLNSNSVSKYVYNSAKDVLYVTLINNKVIELHISRFVFSNQYLRAIRLDGIIRGKNN